MKEDRRAWLVFVGPALLGLFVFYIIPFLWAFYYSLTSNGFERNFVGLQNYIDLFQNEAFWVAAKNTMLFSGVFAPVVMVLAFACAAFLNDRLIPNSYVRSILILPYVLPSAAIVAIWHVFFDYGGLINTTLQLLGVDPLTWMYGENIRWIVFSLYMWRNVGLFAIILLCAIHSINDEYYEVASLEGASRFQMHWHITMPLLKPIFFFLLVLACVNGMRIFKEAYFLGGAYPTEALYTLQHFMNNQFDKFNYSTITAAGYVLLIFMLLIIYIAARLAKRL